MGQVSRPLQIALVATLVIAIAWFLFLRPGEETGEPEPAPSPGAVAGAPAAGVTTGSTPPPADTENEPAPPPKTTPDTTPEADPEPETEDEPKPKTTPAECLARRLDRGHVIVLLFSGEGADDPPVRRAVRSVRARRVTVRVRPLSKMPRYKELIEGVTINHAPTVVVIGPKRRIRTITGLTDRAEITAAIRAVRARKR